MNYEFKTEMIDQLKAALGNDTADDLKNVMSLMHEEMKKQDAAQEKTRVKAVSTILDTIVALHPEFSELSFMAMKNIVNKHIDYMVAEIAWAEKNQIDTLQVRSFENRKGAES